MLEQLAFAFKAELERGNLGDRQIARIKYRPGEIWLMAPLPQHGRQAEVIAEVVKRLIAKIHRRAKHSYENVEFPVSTQRTRGYKQRSPCVNPTDKGLQAAIALFQYIVHQSD